MGYDTLMNLTHMMPVFPDHRSPIAFHLKMSAVYIITGAVRKARQDIGAAYRPSQFLPAHENESIGNPHIPNLEALQGPCRMLE